MCPAPAGHGQPGRHERRAANGLRKQLPWRRAEPVIPFAQPGSLTRVYAIASGKVASESPASR